VNDEKGWWEAEAEASPPDEPPLLSARIVVEEEPEASLIFPPDSFKPDVEVEVGQMPTVLTVLLVVGMLYLFYRMETSDSICLQVCFGILFW
jgi:hypothetical protein